MRTVAILATAGCMLLGIGSAGAQVHQIQQGNVLDASPQVGSAGLNRPVTRSYNLNTGNQIVTGNVSGGGWFRGFSPIRDPNSLFVGSPNVRSPSGVLQGLPTESLTGFRRETLSVNDIRQGRTFTSGGFTPFYSQSGTVTNTGDIVAGRNRPGTSQVLSQYAPLRTDTAVRTGPLTGDTAATGGTLLSVPGQMMRMSTGQPVTGQVNQGLLSSSLFGGFRSVPVTTVQQDAAAAGQALGTGQAAPLDTRLGRMEPLDPRVVRPRTGEQPGDMRSPLERVLGGDATAQSETPQGLQQPVLAAPQPVNAGGDVFESLRSTQGQTRRPIGTPAEGQALVRPLTPPDVTAPPGEQYAPPPAEPFDADAPLRTFVGTEQSAVNRYLSSGETLLRQGQFYRAAGAYEMARAVAPENPLPILGHAIALLAAGDYRTSANSLLTAIRLYAPLGKHRIDLGAFIPDVSVLDRRRADLERRLESYEQPDLRFLLGFAEYSSGMSERGLGNMRRAFTDAPDRLPGVDRFLELLEASPVTATQPSVP